VRKKKLEVIVEKTKMMVLVEKPSFSSEKKGEREILTEKWVCQ
jgi:hypothetical protein